MICSPSHQSRLEGRKEQIAKSARRFLDLIRRTRKTRPIDPATVITIERTRTRLQQIHQMGQGYLPQSPTDTFCSRVIQIRRKDDVPAQ